MTTTTRGAGVRGGSYLPQGRPRRGSNTSETYLHPRPLLEAAGVVLACATFIAVILAAYLVGEHRRCESLRKDGSPLAATYCPQETSR